MRKEYNFGKLNPRKNPYVKDEKMPILCYLTKEYLNAESAGNKELATRLTRAMVAFNYDDMKEPADWKKMCDAYFKECE